MVGLSQKRGEAPLTLQTKAGIMICMLIFACKPVPVKEESVLKTAVRVIILAALLALMAFLVPSMMPLALGEDASAYPVYTPVELEAVTVNPLPLTEKAVKPNKDAYLADKKGYLDDTISVRIETMRDYDTTIMLAWVQIADPSQLRAELCRPYPSKSTARADTLSKRVNAVLAINGDYFVYHSRGFVVRNGKVLRERYDETYDTLIIDDKGDLHIIKETTEEKVKAFEGNIVQAMTFGPGLVIDGERQSGFTRKTFAPEKRTQRISLAQMGPLSYLIVATEGPENKGSKGLTLDQFSQLMYDLGAINAYNLDGGSSSSLVLNNKKINSLSTGKIRAIGDILYFVTLQPTEEASK